MRTLPHDPPLSCFEAMLETVAQEIEAREKERARALDEADSGFFMDLGEERLIRAFLAYVYEEPMTSVVQPVREALRDLRTGFELGATSTAWDVWDYFWYAVAVGDAKSAHFIAGMPEDVWWVPETRPVPWFVVRLQAAFSIFLEEPRAARLLERLTRLVFEPLPPELEDDVPDIQNTCRLLTALHQKKADDFARALKAREEFRARIYKTRGSVSPVALMDLDGLGICRMARDRGILPAFRSPYLPLELFDVPETGSTRKGS